jgi:predicted nuclease with TOPRIM domain
LEFQSGLNVICGASDTGKSFIVEAIDFLLGSGGALRDIPERVGYDRARLAFHTAADETLTLERSTGGGNFSLFNEVALTSEPRSQGRTLRLNPSGTNETLSNFLLSQIGLADKYLQKNQRGETIRLGFRGLVRVVVIREEDIIKRGSPLLSGQYVSQTQEYSMFKLLLTGVDASGLRVEAEQMAESMDSTRSNNTKADFIDELAAELRTELSNIGLSRGDMEDGLSRLEAESREQQEVLTRMQGTLDSSVERRRLLMNEVSKLTGRIDEIGGLVARFGLLKEHYQVDLARLAAIEESGSLFVHLDRKTCPLCGAIPDNQHQGEPCDGDVDSVVHAATAEIAKVKRLSEELDQTITDLQEESNDLAEQRAQILPEYRSLNDDIQGLVSPLKTAQTTFSDVIKQAGELQRALDKVKRLDDLEERKSGLFVAVATSVNRQPSSSSATDSPQVDLSASVLDAFAQKVQQLLQIWNFPGSERVHFDEGAKDVVIGGQPRTSRGKGFRAITHAAMTIGLMEFCKDRNLSHPGFVVLDSPLLAYYAPESEEDSLVGSDLKVRFYDYLASNHRESQIIIIENEHPPSDLAGEVVMTDFTKNPNEGRYGFFPYVE